ncbi:MAG: cyclic pyranopterin monophosphate synthase MoaC [Litorivicinaceae bacterium]
MPTELVSNFAMIDVGGKRVTTRRAIAAGTILLGPLAYEKVASKTLPKGDCFPMSEIAGVMGAKGASALLPMCHPLPLDQVLVRFEMDAEARAVRAFCEAATDAKTGVEMEALAGVNAALLCIWDLCKGTDPVLEITDVALLTKTGGKSGVWINPDQPIPEWVLTQLPSQSCVEGALLRRDVRAQGAEVCAYQVIPDEFEQIQETVKAISEAHDPHVILCTGGTGPGPRDVTPLALDVLLNPELPGLGEWLRSESAVYTKTAWLSRMGGGLVGRALLITLPGSLQAVKECVGIFMEGLPKAIVMIEKQGRKGRL